MLSERGPMDRFEQACQKARELDDYLRVSCEGVDVQAARGIAHELGIGTTG